jgi:D-3-phosphoglycerate dehydrogenase
VLLTAGFEVKRETGLAGDALVAALHGRQALLVRGATKVTREVLEQATTLKVVARAGAGVDNIDATAAQARGVAVFNAPGANAVSVAEHTWGLIFAVLRHIPEADATTRKGLWEKNRLMGSEVAGRTLGVLGLGWVGREVARVGVALRCRVLGFDPDPAAGGRAGRRRARRSRDPVHAERHPHAARAALPGDAPRREPRPARAHEARARS